MAIMNKKLIDIFNNLPEHQQYCPICSNVITANNKEEVDSGEEEVYTFIHQVNPDFEHDDNAIIALSFNIQ